MNIRIKSVAELSIEELEELEKSTQIDGITVEGDRVSSNYSVEEYKQIYQKLLELTEGIDEEWSRTKKFALIYRRVSKTIEYDYIAGYPEKGNKEQEEYSRKESNNCRNLKNGLLKGKCVCAGYAEILRNACLLMGIRAIEYDGKIENSIITGEYHAWDLVEIGDGTWIEVDPTWDHPEANGTRYIGTNKKELWKDHGIGSKGGKFYLDYERLHEDDSHQDHIYESQILGLLYLDHYKIVNLDLNTFINSEFGLDMQYTNKEQTIFIDLIDKRDAQGINIDDELKSLMQSIESRIEFEQECGYTIEELKEYGFTDVEIEKMQASSYDSNTGEKLDRKNMVKQRIDLKHKEEQEFEQECGYTITELKKLGFTDIEIKEMRANSYDSRSEERIDRKKRVSLKIKELNEKKITLTKEDKESIQTKLEEFHPDIADLIISEIEKTIISIKDVDIIIKHIEGNADERETKTVIEKIKVQTEKLKVQDMIAKRKEFEQECGYTIEELKEYGFTDDEIKKMQASYEEDIGKGIDRKAIVKQKIAEKEFEQECNFTIEELKAMGFTDEEIEKMQAPLNQFKKNNRKEVVEEAINKKNKEKSKNSEQDGITLAEVGKGTTSSFSENPVRANYTFGQFEKGVSNQNINDRPQGDE